MQHPFEGVLGPAPDEARRERSTPTPRRAFLGRLLGAVGAFFGFQAVAQAQYMRSPRGRMTTYALGEEGGRVTTQALGEEGGVWGRPPRRPPPTRYWEERRATTYALGEEGGVTTYALGEEGGVTTYALGEEGGVTTYALGEEGGVPTTYALGEEG